MFGYFDSDEVKQAVANEYAGMAATLGAMTMTSERHRMAAQQAVCFVCEAELYPFPGDPNHHVATLNYERDGYHHYCSAHCPACNNLDDDYGYEEDDED